MKNSSLWGGLLLHDFSLAWFVFGLPLWKLSCLITLEIWSLVLNLVLLSSKSRLTKPWFHKYDVGWYNQGTLSSYKEHLKPYGFLYCFRSNKNHLESTHTQRWTYEIPHQIESLIFDIQWVLTHHKDSQEYIPSFS